MVPSPFSFLTVAWERRALLGQLVRRDLEGRYKGSMAGVVWAFVTPMAMLAAYAFVFGVVFRARWGNDGSSPAAFALNMFAGMTVHQIFCEILNRAPRLVVDNVNFVKRVVFPLELLVWSLLGSVLVHGMIGLAILAGFKLVVDGTIPPTAPLVVLILLPLTLFALGIGWLLASLGVFVRDIAQFTTVLTSLLLFLSPVFYPASALPDGFRAVMYLNPLTYAIEQSRRVMIEGLAPDWALVGVALAVGWLAAWLGFAFFRRTRGAFADVV